MKTAEELAAIVNKVTKLLNSYGLTTIEAITVQKLLEIQAMAGFMALVEIKEVGHKVKVE